MRFVLSFLFVTVLSLYVQAQEIDSVQEKKSRIAVYPALGYSPETLWNFGAIGFIVFKDKNEGSGYHRPSSITPYAIYTTNNQVLTKTELDLYFKSGINLNLTARYLKFPDYYFGIGSDTDENIKEQYNNNFFRVEGRINKPINPNLFLGLYYDFQYNTINEYGQDSLLARQSPVGLSGGRNMGLGPGMQFDSRNSTLYPTNGRLFNAGITVFSPLIGSEYKYVKYLLDYRQYFEFLGPKNVIAFQVKAELTSGRDIPFYKLNTIAGDQRLRGITHNNLYRDKQSIYAQIEARQELFWRLGGVIFLGVGEVFNSLSSVNSDDIRFVYGLGGRFRALKDEKLNIRIDLGFSDQGQHAIFLSVKEAF